MKSSLSIPWLLGLGLLSTATCLGCDAPKPETRVKAEKAAPKPKATAAPKEVVFDPTNPPAGWVKCHRNHCHHADGRVASYAMVMKEIGATKIINAPQPKAMPPAPPDVAMFPMDADKSETGLVSKLLKKGTGTEKPKSTSRVTVHYTGWTTDGKAFDSSITRGRPATFPLDRVIAGWTEGLQLMVVGEERRFWIPQALAYQGRPGKPKGDLVFDVELIAILD